MINGDIGSKVVKSFMKVGIPLGKLDDLRDIFEEKALRLADARHMVDFIPFILKEEQETIREEMKDKLVSVIYDGTTRLGEVSAIILRFVDDCD